MDPSSPAAQSSQPNDSAGASSRSRAFRTIWIAYGVALIIASAAALLVDAREAIYVAWWADFAATAAIFAFSLGYRNSSFYDAYWSVAPPFLALFFAFGSDAVRPDSARQLMVIILVTLWSARLTWNWARGWEGLRHEDWRYVNIHEATGALYWPASFLGIHLFPTVMVFLGCLPLHAALATGTRPFGLLDVVATCVVTGAIWLEATADSELRRYRLSQPPAGDFLASGLWARMRHPNYLGEIGFWWGLFLFALAADPGAAWTAVGAVAITVMFRFASLPMIDNRMQQRRPGYAAHMAKVPSLLPRLRSAAR